MNETMRRTVFLDRDGTLIKEVNYLTRPDQIRILPGVPAALRALRKAGFLLLVVTNQSAVARGLLTEGELREIHKEFSNVLADGKAAVDGIYYCPHLPDGEVSEYVQRCRCRKPASGLLARAARDWGVDLKRSYMVGDSERDVQAGKGAGCFTVRIGPSEATEADACVRGLAEAAAMILRREKRLKNAP